MNVPSNHPAAGTLLAIDRLIGHHQAISVALEQASQQAVGTNIAQLSQLADWFRRPIDRQDVLSTAPALMLCLAYLRDEQTSDQPWSDRPPNTPAPNPTHPDPVGLDRLRLDDAIREVSDRWSTQPSNRGLWALLAYPITLLVGCVVVSAFIAIEVVPEFEAMMDEFGLELPWVTRSLFTISSFIRATLIPVALLLAAFGLIAWVGKRIYRQWQRRGHRTLPVATPYRARQRWANWAEHVALLLQAGFKTPEACLIADRSEPARRLPNVSHYLGPLSENLEASPELQLGVLWPDFQWLSSALSMPSGPSQIAKLQAVADSYRDRQRGATVDHAVWITPVATFLIGMIITQVVLALFMPLVDLITGLT